MSSSNPPNTCTTRKAHAHIQRLLYQRDVSGKDPDQKNCLCVASFHMWSGNQTQSDSLLWLVCEPSCSEKRLSFLRSPLPASLFDGQGFPSTDAKGLTPLRRLCSDASFGYRICVIAKGLGCLHWLAHATADGPFFGRFHISAHLSFCPSSLSKIPG